jgi:hypothetical protein
MTYLLTISDYLVTIVLSVLLTLEKNNDAPLSNDFFQHGTWARLDAAMRSVSFSFYFALLARPLCVYRTCR